MKYLLIIIIFTIINFPLFADTKEKQLLTVYVVIDSTSVTKNVRIYHVDYELYQGMRRAVTHAGQPFYDTEDVMLADIRATGGVEDVKVNKYHMYVTKAIFYDWNTVNKNLWRKLAWYKICCVAWWEEWNKYDCRVILTDKTKTFEKTVYTTERIK